MKKIFLAILILYSFFFLSGSVYGLGEKILTLGAASSWDVVEKKQGVTEVSSVRPHPVLVLSGIEAPAENFTGDDTVDLHLSFDEGNGRFSDSRGNYDVFISPSLRTAPAPLSRIGTGAALFTGERSADEFLAGPLALKPKPPVMTPLGRSEALFSPGSQIRDFSIEFWIYPQTIESGALILSWNSSVAPHNGEGNFLNQRILCEVSRNRVQWSFAEFFFSPDRRDRKNLTLMGNRILPGTWSHHLIRYDADLGLLEYLVDGILESLEYTTTTGREGGEVYTPFIGEGCSLVLGSRFSGMMDEFKIHSRYVQMPALAKYPPSGGRMETNTLDLGHANSRLLKIEAFGGRTGGKAGNEYAGNNNLHFYDHSQLRFFVRVNNEPFRWNEVPWVPVNPGVDLSDKFPGRYIQIAADFYPSADGETSPYLSELRISFYPEEPPPPPTQFTGLPKDGAVELSWKASSSRDARYLVYYGTASGEYFGDNAVLVSTAFPVRRESPIDVGGRTSVRIEGLKNGTLYFFTVASYSVLSEPGDFSREIAVRPLRMAE